MFKISARAIRKAIAAVTGLLSMATVLVAQSAAPTDAGRAKLIQTYVKLPISFEANQGQTDERVKFTARGAGYALFLTSDGATLLLNEAQGAPATGENRGQNAILTMRLLGANQGATVAGLEQLPGKTNYFLGSDPQKWRTGVPTYGKVRYAQIYPGVDLVYYGTQRQLEYDFVLAPAANPNAIRLKLDEAPGNSRKPGLKQRDIHIAANGDLVIVADGHEVRFHRPLAYQNHTTRRTVEARYVLRAHNRIEFKLGSYDHRQPLVIDPVLTYSTFVGGSSNDGATAIKIDPVGNAYITGGTTSTDFPTVSGAAQSAYGGSSGSCMTFAFECGDAFVTKIDASGNSALFSTYLGGSQNDTAFGLAVDSTGSAYIVGETYSSNFPHTSGAFQTGLSGTHNGFVTKLNWNGTLVYSTYLGGNDQDTAAGIALDSSGNAYVAGRTRSTNFPTTTGALQTTEQGGQDGFVTKLNANGTGLVYSTYLGGSSNDAANAIAVDSSGNAYVTGQTTSSNFPVLNAYQTTFAGGGTDCGSGIVCGDVIVTKLNASGSALLYSTYLGGSAEEAGAGITVDAGDNAFIVGGTDSTNFPVTYGAPQSAYAGGSAHCGAAGLACGDAFVARINTLASGPASLAFSTYIGGSGDDLALGVALDSSGHVHISGGTNSANFPVTGAAVQASYGGGTGTCGVDMLCGDAFVLTLTNLGSAIMYSSYLGGSGDDFGFGVAVSSTNTYLTGATASASFPITSGAYDTSCTSCSSGASDAFVSEVPGTEILPLAESPTLNVDFDGSGMAGFGIFRPDDATWWINNSSGVQNQVYGLPGDIPVAADFDGDGKSDIGLWRPSNGTWYYISSRTGLGVSYAWGTAGDIPVPADYDGDGRADYGVWRPSTGTWYYIASSTGQSHHVQWGAAGDIPAPGDYDGDGKADLAVFRPSNGTWYYIASSTGLTAHQPWGTAGDMPAEGDYDGDGKTDFAVWRPSDGTWYIIPSSTGVPFNKQWGEAGDIPVVGDYNGDRKNDYAVWRPSEGTWYIAYTSGGTEHVQWGETGDIPATYLPSMIRRDKHIANFDGDRKTDMAVWTPSSGTWSVIDSSTSQTVMFQYGTSGDVIVPGDYDGDGQTDYAVWRPSNGTWYVTLSSTGTPVRQQWGVTGDIPVPGDYDGDGQTDYAIWRPSTGTWYVIPSSGGATIARQWGENGDIPVPADYDGDGKTDYAIWRPSTGTWWVVYSSTGTTATQQWGASTDIPVPGDYDGDTKADYTVFRPSDGTWHVLQSSDGTEVKTTWGISTDIPVPGDYDGDEKTDIAVWRPSNGTFYVVQSSTGKSTSTALGTSTDIPVNEPTGQIGLK
jgi:hypothetical protein